MFYKICFYIFIIFLGLWAFQEYLRFEDAKHIVFQQRQDYQYVVSHKSYCGGSDNVRTIQFNGITLDCATLKLALLQSVANRAFVFWWQTSVWVTQSQRLLHNGWMMAVLLVVVVVMVIWIGFQSCVQVRLNDQMVNQYEKITKQIPATAAVAAAATHLTLPHHDEDDAFRHDNDNNNVGNYQRTSAPTIYDDADDDDDVFHYQGKTVTLGQPHNRRYRRKY